jgi:glucose-6-phosphate 1-dehydrogenase
MIGDPTLFMRADMVEHGWRIVQPLLDAWAHGKSDLSAYPSGGEGPEAADVLIGDDGGRRWRPIQAPPAARDDGKTP